MRAGHISTGRRGKALLHWCQHRFFLHLDLIFVSRTGPFLSGRDVINRLVLITDLAALTDDMLTARVAALAARSRETTAELVWHLVELERRGLHLACGFSSLFVYCRKVLHCSENGAFDRVRAARAARRFPVVLAMLAEGRLHLTAVRLLSPHLKDENHLALLGGAIRKSGADVRELLARWFPERDVPASVRRLPARKVSSVAATETAPAAKPVAGPGPGQCAATSNGETESAAGASEGTASSSGASAEPAAPQKPAAPPRAPVRPLSVGRFEFRFTGDDETEALLREARELLSHSRPEIATIFKRGLQLVVAEARHKRFAATNRPRPAQGVAEGSRDIPADVQRAVWDRDGGQCPFVGSNGWRCDERQFLEYHHLTPWIVGGAPSVVNIALRCRAHNQYEAKAYFAPIRRAMENAERRAP